MSSLLPHYGFQHFLLCWILGPEHCLAHVAGALEPRSATLWLWLEGLEKTMNLGDCAIGCMTQIPYKEPRERPSSVQGTHLFVIPGRPSCLTPEDSWGFPKSACPGVLWYRPHHKASGMICSVSEVPLRWHCAHATLFQLPPLATSERTILVAMWAKADRRELRGEWSWGSKKWEKFLLNTVVHEKKW